MKQQQYRGFGFVLIIVLIVLMITTLAGRNNDALSEQEYYQALEASRPQDDEDPDLCPIRDFMFAQQMKYLSMEIKKYRQAEKKGGMRFIF